MSDRGGDGDGDDGDGNDVDGDDGDGDNGDGGSGDCGGVGGGGDGGDGDSDGGDAYMAMAAMAMMAMMMEVAWLGSAWLGSACLGSAIWVCRLMASKVLVLMATSSSTLDWGVPTLLIAGMRFAAWFILFAWLVLFEARRWRALAGDEGVRWVGWCGGSPL